MTEEIDIRTELTKRVAVGAAWLDENYPEWYTHIDVGKLEMSATRACIMGQIGREIAGESYSFWDFIEDDYNPPECPMFTPMLAALVMTKEESLQRGFLLEGDLDNYSGRYKILDDLWTEAVKDRFAKGGIDG